MAFSDQISIMVFIASWGYLYSGVGEGKRRSPQERQSLLPEHGAYPNLAVKKIPAFCYNPSQIE
jgi:hypothetical protein